MKRQVKTHGQHFLRGSAFIAELVGHSNLRKNDLVLDIGAGSGAITAVLARRAKRVVAYEVEPQALALLQKNMKRHDNVEIVAYDFFDSKLPTEKFKVFANIPFSLSSKVVRRLCLEPTTLSAMYLIVQKQFAAKLVLDSAHFHGALGVMIGPWWTARIRRPLKKTDFTPPPAVDTVLLEIKRREEPLLPYAAMEPYALFVERCYAEPRFFSKVPAPKGRKPSELSLDEWTSLYRKFVGI